MKKTAAQLLDDVASLIERDLLVLATIAPSEDNVDTNADTLSKYAKALSAIADRESKEAMHKQTMLSQMSMAQLLAGLPPELKEAYELATTEKVRDGQDPTREE